MIRLWGVFAFFVVVGLVVILWWLLAGWIVERVAEEVGSEIVGARVDVESADVGLFPLSFALHRVQVTDPDEPMSNVVELGRIAAGVDLLPLFRRKVLIDEMAIEGVQLGTPRERSGELPGGKRRTEHLVDAARQRAEALELPSFEVPDVDAILASEELESLAIIGEARELADDLADEWKARIDELPDDARFEAYRARIDELQATDGTADMLAAAPELAALQKEIRADIDALQSAMTDMKDQSSDFGGVAERAAAAPARDVRRLQEKYGLSPQGLANLSNRLFGPKVGVLTARALAWWQRIEPLVSRLQAAGDDGVAEPLEPGRGRGIDVRFPERNPSPDLLIRKAIVSLELAEGNFSGVVSDITPDQPVHGQPLRFRFEGSELSGLDRIDVRGTFDRVDPAKGSDEFVVSVVGFAVEGMALSQSEAWGIELARARMDLDVTGRRVGHEIEMDADAELMNVDLTTDFSDTGPVATAIADTLDGINGFDLQAKLRGTPGDPVFSVRSDLDRALSGAVSKLVSGQMSRFGAELSKGITAQTAGPLKDLQAATVRFGSLEQEVGKRIDLGHDVLSGALAGGTKGKSSVPGGFELPF